MKPRTCPAGGRKVAGKGFMSDWATIVCPVCRTKQTVPANGRRRSWNTVDGMLEQHFTVPE